MANTYTQISIHLVFAVRSRNALIRSEIKEILHKYISGILKNQKQKLLAINSMPDHIHIFFRMHPDTRLSYLVRDIKKDSSNFINNKKLSKYKFYWQNGYGAFSYSKSQRAGVINYIKNQEIHHRKKSFRDEYLDFLRKFEIEFEENYLFNFIN